MTQLFANNASSALAAGITAIATSIQLTTATGSVFPNPVAPDYFLATLVGIDANGNEIEWEIVKVTARTGDMLAVLRGQEGTTAAVWGVGTKIELRFTAGGMSTFAQTSTVNAQIAAIDTVGPALCLS